MSHPHSFHSRLLHKLRGIPKGFNRVGGIIKAMPFEVWAIGQSSRITILFCVFGVDPSMLFHIPCKIEDQD